MCSLAFTSFLVSRDELISANELQKLRGPDSTIIKEFNGNILLHNLLSITGNYLEQPLFNKSGDIALLFNGEIYNYKKFGNFKSDAQCLLDLYENDPSEFFKCLDGEYAFVIYDSKKDEIVVASDVFGTKPLHMGGLNGRIGISSYPSFLKRLGIENPVQIKSNSIFHYSLKEMKTIRQQTIKTFNLNQYKDSYEDWLNSFSNSIRKRTEGATKNIFISFSSGYDSGIIFHELNTQNVNFDTFYIPTNEDLDILNERMVFFKEYKNFNRVVMNSDDIKKFTQSVENFDYKFQNQCIFNDRGAAGMYQVCKNAKEEDNKILISGQGSDEIFSDYGILGYDRYGYSTFSGIFPDDLHDNFPWNNFYGGKQRAYLLKEESVCGAFGIESRYPFLDTDVVQEFLSLSVKLKNRRYKSPIDYYFNKYKFPYLMNDKKGFSP